MTSIAESTFQLKTAVVSERVRLRNLTGRPVVVYGDGVAREDQERVVLLLPAEDGRVPVLDAARLEVGWLEGGRYPVPVVGTRRLGVRNLPGFQPDVLLVVPRLIAESCPERCDLVYVDRIVRERDGQIVGCRAFGSVCIGSESLPAVPEGRA